MKTSNLPKIIAAYPGLFYGKYFEYKAKKVNNHYEIYRREIEGDPWELYARCVVVDDIVFGNYAGIDRKEYNWSYK